MRTFLRCFSIFIASFLFLHLATSIWAHSGRTDSSGCHNCYTSACAGEYHCHGGGSIGGGSGYTPIIRTPTTPEFPKAVKARFEFIPNPDGKTFNVKMDWDDSPNTGYSITLEKYIRDPGPKTDTMQSNYTFSSIYPGKYYANLKVGINNIWSKPVYWDVQVPKWYPPPSPTPLPTIHPSVKTSNTNDTQGDLFIVVVLLLLLSMVIGSIYIAFRVLRWFLNYAQEHDWIYTVLFYGVILAGLYIWSLFSNKPTGGTTNLKTKSSYSCNCSKTCPNLSCAEAQYQLNECGCRQRDADHDGIACDAQCQ